jgi:hypothetical protein
MIAYNYAVKFLMYTALVSDGSLDYLCCITDTALDDLLKEIGDSMHTLDADAPRERILPCPQCEQEKLVARNQQSGSWELSCCDHIEEHRTRATVAQL